MEMKSKVSAWVASSFVIASGFQMSRAPFVNGHSEQVGNLREAEIRRQHADDRVRVAVQRNCPADNAGVGPESAAPQRIVQDHDTIASDRVLLREEHTAELRPHTEHREQRCRCARSLKLFGLASARQIQAEAAR